MKWTLVDIARLFLFVREVPENRGLRVEAIQHWSGGQPGDSWCMEMVWLWVDLLTSGNAPIPRMQACQTLNQTAKDQGWLVQSPQLGDIVLTVNDAGLAHHAGVVSSVNPLKSIAGNTSADGVSVNGDRVAEHEISPVGKVFIRLPI